MTPHSTRAEDAPVVEPGGRTYPYAEIAKLHAPREKDSPCVKLRRLLRSRFAIRRTAPDKCCVRAVAAYDALTAAILADLGYEAIGASGTQLAAARALYPDIGAYPSHAMVELVRELQRGVEGARDRHFYDSGGEVRGAPPILADIEARFGGPVQAFVLAREVIRAGAAGVLLDDRSPAPGEDRAPAREWIGKLVAVKAAAQAAEEAVVVVARVGAADEGGREGGVERALGRAFEAAELGVDVVCPEFGDTSLEAPRRFAEGVHRRFPEQMLAFHLSPSLHWGQAKKEGRLPTSRQLGELGYVLQFSATLAFRTAGMALESWLRGFRQRGLDALADLQLVEAASLDGEPRTRLQQRFAGAGRWRALESIARGAAAT